jgi:SAM-dependent methyltransferase
MYWKRKALIQRGLAAIPRAVGDPLYYTLQRRFGGLRQPDWYYALDQARRIVANIERHHRRIDGAAVVELGTGRTLNVPIGLWLCGVAEIVTLDLHKYLQPKMVHDLLAYIGSRRDAITQLFAPYSKTESFQRRLEVLLNAGPDVNALCSSMRVRYLAPADGTALTVPTQSVDFHVSTTVLEHIPPDVLRHILLEARRVLRNDGLLIHGINLSDHFAHADPTITSVNFLQFTEAEWASYAGNRFMYHNRLRIDDYEALFEGAGFTILSKVASIDERAVAHLRAGFRLADRFRGKTPEVNATCDAGLVGAIAA